MQNSTNLSTLDDNIQNETVTSENTEDIRKTVGELQSLIREYPSLAEAQKKLAERDAGIRSLGRALKKVARIFTFGCFLGILLLIIHNLIGDVALKGYAFLLKDIGLGLLVAAFSVVLYEWGSHIKGALDLSETLIGAINSVDKTREELKDAKVLSDTVKGELEQVQQHLTQVSGLTDYVVTLKNDLDSLRVHQGESAGNRALDLIFPRGATEEDFKQHIRQIIGYARKLEEAESPESKQYLGFIAYLLGSVANNARLLSRLEKSLLVGNSVDSWIYQMDNPRKIASEILSSQMRVMQGGNEKQASDSYDSLTNVLYYSTDDEMDGFWQATCDAISRGVYVRRIFNLSSFTDDPDVRGKYFTRSKKTVEDHLKFSYDSNGRYEVRFFTPALSDRFERILFKPMNFPRSSYGLFRHVTRNTVVLFETMDPKRLSKMSLTCCSDNESHVRFFEEMWKVCEGVKNPFRGVDFDFQVPAPEDKKDHQAVPDIKNE